MTPPMKISCMSCGNEMLVDEERAGRLLRCEMCGASVKAPAAARPDDPFWRDPGFAQRPANAAQRVGRLLGILSGLGCFTTAGVIVFAGAVPKQDIAIPPEMFPAGGGPILFVMAAVYVGLGLIYLLGGLNIRNGGAASALLVLAVSPIHI